VPFCEELPTSEQLRSNGALDHLAILPLQEESVRISTGYSFGTTPCSRHWQAMGLYHSFCLQCSLLRPRDCTVSYTHSHSHNSPPEVALANNSILPWLANVLVNVDYSIDPLVSWNPVSCLCRTKMIGCQHSNAAQVAFLHTVNRRISHIGHACQPPVGLQTKSADNFSGRFPAVIMDCRPSLRL